MLGSDLRGEQRNEVTVLVIRDPWTGEEFASALEASEQQRKILEDQVRTEEARSVPSGRGARQDRDPCGQS